MSFKRRTVYSKSRGIGRELYLSTAIAPPWELSLLDAFRSKIPLSSIMSPCISPNITWPNAQNILAHSMFLTSATFVTCTNHFIAAAILLAMKLPPTTTSFSTSTASEGPAENSQCARSHAARLSDSTRGPRGKEIWGDTHLVTPRTREAREWMKTRPSDRPATNSFLPRDLGPP